MQKNVGGYDRLVRFVLGPVLLVAGATALVGLWSVASGTLGIAISAAAVLIGLVFIVTASVQKCPLNEAIGLDTYTPPGEADTTPETDTKSARSH